MIQLPACGKYMHLRQKYTMIQLPARDKYMHLRQNTR